MAPSSSSTENKLRDANVNQNVSGQRPAAVPTLPLFSSNHSSWIIHVGSQHASRARKLAGYAAGLCQEILARASPQPARSQLYLTSTTALGDSLAVVSRGRVVADVTLTS